MKKNVMKKNDLVDELEDVAREGLKAMRAYLTYQGGNKEYLQKAKVGGTAVAAYTRHFASLTNRDALGLALKRQELPDAKK